MSFIWFVTVPVVSFLFRCTPLGGWVAVPVGWLSFCWREEMAALSSIPWQAKVKLWTNSQTGWGKNKGAKAKSGRWDGVAVQPFSPPDDTSNCAPLIAVWKCDLMLFLLTAILKSLDPSNKGAHTVHKNKQSGEIFVAFGPRGDPKSLSQSARHLAKACDRKV